MWSSSSLDENRQPEGADSDSPSGSAANQQTTSSAQSSALAHNMRGEGSSGPERRGLPSDRGGGSSSARQIPGRESVHYVLGNMPTANAQPVHSSSRSEEDADADTDDRENGYPLVADLTQLRIHNHLMRSVDDVIEQQAFNQEVIDDLNAEQRNAQVANAPGGPGDGVGTEEETDSASGEASRRGDARTEQQQQAMLSASVADRLAAITSGSVAPSFVFSDAEAAELMMASGTSAEGESPSGVGNSRGGNSVTSGIGNSVTSGIGNSRHGPANALFDAVPRAEAAPERPSLRRPPRHRPPALGQQLPSTSGAEASNQSQQYPLHNAAAVGRSANDASLGGSDTLPLWETSSGNNAVAQPSMGWQATKSTLKERFSFMYCNQILADVYFVVGRGDQRERIPAHKFVLSTGSAVFDAMFNGSLGCAPQELAHSSAVPEIELPDVEPTAFLALLKFLYSDDVSIGPESVMTTLYTAKKYAVPAMESACVEFLKRNLGADNAFMLLTQARLFDEPQLANLCLDVIDKNTLEALNADGFTEIDLDTLCAVVKRDTLRVREAPLFMAVLRWSAEECRRRALPLNADNQRKVLGKALQMVRFPLMTIDEFAQYVAQSGILVDRELVSMFLYFTVNPKPQIEFVDVPRCCVFGKEVVVSRFQRVEGRWGYSGTPDRIKFTVDRKIYVIGFGLHGSIHGPHEYQVTIQILHCGTGKVLASNDTLFPCDGSSATFRVLFKEPVEIAPCVTYIASACLKGPDSHYGTKGLRRVVHQSPSSGVVTFQFTYAAGNNNGTSVEDGQIPEIIFCTKIN